MRILIEKPGTTLFEPFIEGRVKHWRPTIRYLSQTEVHVYALAIGASVLLSFVPFLIVMLTLIRSFLPSAESALYLALHDVFPSDLGKFVESNLRLNMDKLHHGRLQVTSVILLLFTANGVFEPLEVALNRAWGAKNNRSYLRNQLLSFFLILLCGGLALGSVILTTFNENYVQAHFGLKNTPAWMPLLIFKIAAIPVTIVALFLTYWILPNCKVPPGRIFRVAVLVGLALEVLKYAFFRAWPWLDKKFTNEYSPFQHSASIIALSMVASLIVLAGAEWSARKPEEPSPPLISPSPVPLR